mmetsp:Transcript_12803/g.19828  ORF Transcript_12803/g.19828 Transcript_12803/m.19828 type:complete len:107 (-) Transcript_12803:865-1185(-)
MVFATLISFEALGVFNPATPRARFDHFLALKTSVHQGGPRRVGLYQPERAAFPTEGPRLEETEEVLLVAVEILCAGFLHSNLRPIQLWAQSDYDVPEDMRKALQLE